VESLHITTQSLFTQYTDSAHTGRHGKSDQGLLPCLIRAWVKG